jgi:hypothetical protein
VVSCFFGRHCELILGGLDEVDSKRDAEQFTTDDDDGGGGGRDTTDLVLICVIVILAGLLIIIVVLATRTKQEFEPMASSPIV